MSRRCLVTSRLRALVYFHAVRHMTCICSKCAHTTHFCELLDPLLKLKGIVHTKKLKLCHHLPNFQNTYSIWHVGPLMLIAIWMWSQKERRAYGIRTTQGWVNHDIIFMFGWTSKIRCRFYSFFSATFTHFQNFASFFHNFTHKSKNCTQNHLAK